MPSLSYSVGPNDAAVKRQSLVARVDTAALPCWVMVECQTIRTRRGRDAASMLREVFCSLSYCGQICKVYSVTSFLSQVILELTFQHSKMFHGILLNRNIFPKQSHIARGVRLDWICCTCTQHREKSSIPTPGSSTFIYSKLRKGIDFFPPIPRSCKPLFQGVPLEKPRKSLVYEWLDKLDRLDYNYLPCGSEQVKLGNS